MRVAVTGGSGFVGRAVCSHLRDRGCEVVALSRDGGRSLPEGVKVVHGDLHDQERIADLVHGAQVVVHSAGLVRSRDGAALRAANVDALAALLRGCGEVERFVHLSTAGVHGLPGGQVDESAGLAPANDYEASKAAAESLLREVRPDGTVAVRPTNILGVGHPRDPLARFLASVEAGRLFTWSGAASNYVGVDTVAAAVGAAVLSPDPPPTVLVNDPRPVVDLASLAARLLGVVDRTHLIPAGVARAARHPVAGLERWLRPLHRVRSVLETTSFQTAHAGWLAAAGVTTDIEPVLAAMICDYRQRGLL